MAEADARDRQVVGREFDRHLVAREDADAMLAHLPAGVGHDGHAVLQLDAKPGVGQHLGHYTLHLDRLFLRHAFLSWLRPAPGPGNPSRAARALKSAAP